MFVCVLVCVRARIKEFYISMHAHVFMCVFIPIIYVTIHFTKPDKNNSFVHQYFTNDDFNGFLCHLQIQAVWFFRPIASFNTKADQKLKLFNPSTDTDLFHMR